MIPSTLGSQILVTPPTQEPDSLTASGALSSPAMQRTRGVRGVTEPPGRDSVVPVRWMLAEGFQPTPWMLSTCPSGSWLPEGCLGVAMLAAPPGAVYCWGGLVGMGVAPGGDGWPGRPRSLRGLLAPQSLHSDLGLRG